MPAYVSRLLKDAPPLSTDLVSYVRMSLDLRVPSVYTSSTHRQYNVRRTYTYTYMSRVHIYVCISIDTFSICGSLFAHACLGRDCLYVLLPLSFSLSRMGVEKPPPLCSVSASRENFLRSTDCRPSFSFLEGPVLRTRPGCLSSVFVEALLRKSTRRHVFLAFCFSVYFFLLSPLSLSSPLCIADGALPLAISRSALLPLRLRKTRAASFRRRREMNIRSTYPDHTRNPSGDGAGQSDVCLSPYT